MATAAVLASPWALLGLPGDAGAGAVTQMWPPGASAADAPPAAGVLALSPTAVALAAGLIAVQALVSLKFHLGLHTQLAVAAVRCVVQLSILGYVLGALKPGSGASTWDANPQLSQPHNRARASRTPPAPCPAPTARRRRCRPRAVPIFSYNQIWLVLLYCAFMVWVSALEAIGRPSKTFRVRLRQRCCRCRCRCRFLCLLATSTALASQSVIAHGSPEPLPPINSGHLPEHARDRGRLS
jgi:hypothetical protein